MKESKFGNLMWIVFTIMWLIFVVIGIVAAI